MQKQGLLKVSFGGISIEQDFGGDESNDSDSSEQETRRSPRGKRQRANSKVEKTKEKN